MKPEVGSILFHFLQSTQKKETNKETDRPHQNIAPFNPKCHVVVGKSGFQWVVAFQTR